MNKHRPPMNVGLVLAAFCVGLAQASENGTRCELNPDLNQEDGVIRAEPGSSSQAIGRISEAPGHIRALDEISKGPGSNDWIKVQVGDVTGWIKADSVRCRLSPEEAKEQIAEETTTVIQALHAKDFQTVSRYIHPVKGLRLSPSATVAPKADVVLTAEQAAHWLTGTAKRVWGHADGTGAPIRLSPSAYYRRFIYDRDFAAAPVVAFNTAAARSTDRNNAEEIYPNALVVEYYFPPSVEDGNDWASLRLVYEKHDGRWFLSGLIHDNWTI